MVEERGGDRRCHRLRTSSIRGRKRDATEASPPEEEEEEAIRRGGESPPPPLYACAHTTEREKGRGACTVVERERENQGKGVRRGGNLRRNNPPAGRSVGVGEGEDEDSPRIHKYILAKLGQKCIREQKSISNKLQVRRNIGQRY